MIDITQLTTDDIGKWVLYTPPFKTEKGRIKSWNDKYIFVVFHSGEDWAEFKEYTGCATKPDDLSFKR